MLDLLAGRLPSESDAVSLVQARTRQFAKRQLTWFRGLAEVRFLPLSGGEPPEATADRAAAWMVATGREGRDPSGHPGNS